MPEVGKVGVARLMLVPRSSLPHFRPRLQTKLFQKSRHTFRYSIIREGVKLAAVRWHNDGRQTTREEGGTTGLFATRVQG